jgi:hypothetical protein
MTRSGWRVVVAGGAELELGPERAHEAHGELAVAPQQVLEVLAPDREQLAVAVRPHRRRPRAPGQQRELTDDLASADAAQHALLVLGDDVQTPGADDVQPVAGVAGAEHPLAGAELLHRYMLRQAPPRSPAETAEQADLELVERSVAAHPKRLPPPASAAGRPRPPLLRHLGGHVIDREQAQQAPPERERAVELHPPVGQPDEGDTARRASSAWAGRRRAGRRSAR